MISGGQAGGWSPIDWFNNLGAAGKVITIIILGLACCCCDYVINSSNS